ncbi:valacyclovir hydrolase, putative [Talaromyces stipitatus ATCC 10500]|uniref:Valacyclovir hydrolase, putative n=1 Tax=Talaromyces stipitatus (strain ATCC 10500 / CBS 375.48 / QM 6759 / NRRL 1006) TaxID=441959 RepID=B8M0M7_TALSN|nr:valacyclovir hydrolase, putative [Talaromyces stipitatus ATCC 10500]EED21410.1 valacyclovir hydrolase, putative [Talaromyces stipitatus ATCC 10500]
MFSSISSYIRTSNGTKVNINQSGNPRGPLIILLHGLGGSTETFTPLLPYLYPETNRLISVDLEGFGKTGLSSPEVKLSIPRYVDDLDSIVASLQGSGEEEREGTSQRKIVIIGHSLGSIIAMHYAGAHPEIIDGLVLLGAGRSIAHIPAARERMLSLATKARTEGISAVADVAAISNFPPPEQWHSMTTTETREELREIVRRAVMDCDAEAYAKACEAVAGLDHLDPDYGNITAPTLLLAGSGDMISPLDRSMGLKDLIGGNAWVKVLDGVGHQMTLQDLDGGPLYGDCEVSVFKADT